MNFFWKWVVVMAAAGIALTAYSNFSRAEPLTVKEAAVLLEPSVVELRRGKGKLPFCTATKIGEGSYLTALHCVRGLATDMKVVSPGHDDNPVVGAYAPLVSKKLENQNKQARQDWAVLYTEKVNDEIPSVPLACGEEVYMGQPIAYMGYGVPLNLGFFAGHVVSVNSSTRAFRGANFDFAVSTLVSGGASGSALLSLDTGKIIGVVTEFVPADRDISHATGIQQTGQVKRVLNASC